MFRSYPYILVQVGKDRSPVLFASHPIKLDHLDIEVFAIIESVNVKPLDTTKIDSSALIELVAECVPFSVHLGQFLALEMRVILKDFGSHYEKKFN